MIAININQSKNFVTWERLSNKQAMSIIDKIRYRFVKINLIADFSILVAKEKAFLKDVKSKKIGNFSSQDLVSILKVNTKISELLKKLGEIKKGFLDRIFLKLLEDFYAISKEIESLIIKEAFEDETPITGFSSSFNDWNKEEENIWEQYL